MDSGHMSGGVPRAEHREAARSRGTRQERSAWR